jgi:aldehyde:ferredoxin oxidoreductase
MTGGYVGKLLFVDLTEGTTREEELSEDLARKFIGGYGLGVRILYDMMPGGVDPLGPDNVLGFLTGPLTGSGAVFSGRYVVVCKSPVSGTWNDANSGGYFGPELKKAGYDAVFISGASEKPVYLWINDGEVELRDASKLWGLDATESLQALIEDTGEKKMRAALIGPAGERQSLLACIMNDRHRAAGRGGAGAVMGSKKLKAVAVRGTGEVPVADPKRLKAINRTVRAAMKDGPMAQMMAGFGEYGTGMGNVGSALSGDSPVKNWGGVGVIDFGADAANNLSVPPIDAKYKTKAYGCASCPLACGAHYEVNDGPWPIGHGDRPEYETWAAFGSTCLNSNAEAIIKVNDICNRAGLDTISTGMTVAWAIECYENEVLNRQETGGIELTWGNGAAIVDITQALADGKGLGATLALGSKAAADKLGKGHEYLVTVRGIEVPMHDPKLGPGLARTYQYDATPARHVKGGAGLMQIMDPTSAKYNYEGTGFLDVMVTSNIEMINICGLCLFGMYAGVEGVQMQLMEAVTGWSFKSQDQMQAAMRVMNMKQAFNLREGLTPADFSVPARIVGKPPQEAGPVAGVTVDNDRLADNFFAAMGWDRETGKPSRRMLELMGGMDDVIEDLYD